MPLIQEALYTYALLMLERLVALCSREKGVLI